jgi:hypothetical protein
MANASRAGRWFRRVVWTGIAANLALALPTIAAPAQIIAASGLPTATPDLWPRFAGVLLVLLSVFYIPAAVDIDRHRATAWFTVASRLTGVVFFAFEPGYRILGLFDLAFLVPQAILLTLAVRGTTAAAPAQAPAPGLGAHV